MNGASLLLAALKWMLLVVWPARLPCEWIETVGGMGLEETRGDSPFSTPSPQAEAKVRLGLESWWPSFWLVADPSLGWWPSSVFPCSALAQHLLGLSSDERKF